MSETCKAEVLGEILRELKTLNRNLALECEVTTIDAEQAILEEKDPILLSESCLKYASGIYACLWILNY